MESTLRRTWAEIDLDALAYNYYALRRRVGADVKFLGVVKADGYGHGAVQVSRTLQTLGVWTRPWSCGRGASPCPSLFWGIRPGSR